MCLRRKSLCKLNVHNLPVAGFTRLKTAHRIFHCNKQNMNEYWNAQSIIQDLQLTFFPFRYRTLPSIRSILRDLLAGRTDNHTKLRIWAVCARRDRATFLCVLFEIVFSTGSCVCYNIFRTPKQNFKCPTGTKPRFFPVPFQKALFRWRYVASSSFCVATNIIYVTTLPIYNTDKYPTYFTSGEFIYNTHPVWTALNKRCSDSSLIARLSSKNIFHSCFDVICY